MNSIDRVVKAVTFQEVDRVPVIPIALMQGSKLLGIDLPKYQTNGEYLAEGQIRLLEKLEHDAVFGVPHVVQDLVPWGSKLRYYNNGSPTIDSLAIRNESDILNLKVPDPSKYTETKESLKATNILSKKVGSHTPVIVGMIAPFSLPSMLMGTGPFMRLLIEEDKTGDKYLKMLFNKCKEFVVKWAKQLVDQGANVVVLADGIASQTVISRRLFEKHALDLIKETISEIPVPVVWEAVGSAEGIIDLTAETGAVAVIVDYTDDLEVCKKKANGKIALMGNFNNIEMMYWNELKTQLEVKKAIKKAAHGYGYIVSSQGPELPYDVPFEVIESMVNATKKFGKY